ncbi:MAG TPA: Xaa-Pro peptidase family protein [Thermoanaerobaculia bacterium]|nr:Xaa-Pro peptidase family protein [Thermoanaerobaculia bacterium]
MPLNRRQWIISAGAAAGAAALPGRATAASPPQPLPPPLPATAFRERQDKLRAAARAQGLDALFVTPCSNLAYSANLAIGRSERLTALLLFADGPAVLVTPTFEEANHRKNAVIDDVQTWKEQEDPIALVARLLQGKKSVGIEGSTAFETVSKLEKAAAASVADASAVFDALRRVKSIEEQTLIRAAGERTTRAIAATHRRIRSGMTEEHVSNILDEEFKNLGVRGSGLVQFGPNAAFPHGAPEKRTLSRGDVVLIDCGCKVHGYNSDVTRTATFGSASDEVRKVFQIVEKAQTAGIEALHAGTIPEEADAAARKVIEDAGYGQFFEHRLGHGLGMDGHESPYVVRGNRAPLVAGNVVTVEPGIYLPGKFGVRIEDDYAVRPTSPPEGLSDRYLELEVLPD